MKILHVTPIAPGRMSGGEQGIRQSLLMLHGCREMIEQLDYAGPPVKEEKLRKLYNNAYELKADYFVIRGVAALLKGETNRRYYAWKNSGIDFSQYDLLYMDSTKLDYIAETVKNVKSDIKVITRVHNIEKDYAWVDFKRNKSLSRFIIAMLAKRQEQKVADQSDLLLMLSQNDVYRFKKVYGFHHLKSFFKIVPVCVQERADFQCQRKDVLHILLTGSLWFGPNADGVIWFLDKVVPLLNKSCVVKIAGAKPNRTVKKKCYEKRIELEDTPDDMDPLLRKADVIAVPIFDGAGMKVKFAEALSYGKIVVSTSFGAVGYDVSNGVDCMIADDEKNFADALNRCLAMTLDERQKLCKAGFSLFQKKYSMESGIKRMRKILSGI